MKTILFLKSNWMLFLGLFISSFFITGCRKVEPIPQSELTGIWKLNGYIATTYKMEITQDGFLYWWNYNDWYNHVEEFELRYDVSTNMIRLRTPGKSYTRHTIPVVRLRNGHIVLQVTVTGTDVDGHTINQTVEYYKMN